MLNFDHYFKNYTDLSVYVEHNDLVNILSFKCDLSTISRHHFLQILAWIINIKVHESTISASIHEAPSYSTVKTGITNSVQNSACVYWCKEILIKCNQGEPKVVRNIYIGEKSLIYKYELEIKEQSSSKVSQIQQMLFMEKAHRSKQLPGFVYVTGHVAEMLTTQNGEF